MIELQTSNENALALYSLLSEGQRNGIRVNGTLLSEIRRRGLLVYMNTPANFWSSNAWNLETNMFVGNFNEKIRKYWTNTSTH